MDIKTFQGFPLRWTNHAAMRVLQRGITSDDIHAVIDGGEMIDSYLNDLPYPSGLVLGYSCGRPLHVVCASDGTQLWIITAYEPDAARWEADARTRKG